MCRAPSSQHIEISDADRVLIVLQIGKLAVVVGTSLGGTAAMDFALTHPEDVAALVLIMLIRRYRRHREVKKMEAPTQVIERPTFW